MSEKDQPYNNPPEQSTKEDSDQWENEISEHPGGHSFWVLNKAIARKIGSDAGLLLADLLSKWRYFKSEGQLDKEGYFYSLRRDRQKETGLSPYRQHKAIKILERFGILYPVVWKGMPPKQWFKFNHETLMMEFSNNITIELNDSKKSSLENNHRKLNNITIEPISTRSSAKKLVPYNNSKNKSIKIKEIDSKESIIVSDETIFKKSPSQKKSLPDFILPRTGEYAVLQSWNKLPCPASKHKPNTKTARRIVGYLEEMRNGVFGELSRRKWDVNWIARHKIDMKKFAERKWKIWEICQVIEGPLANMYKDGYWPPDKSRVPKSLPIAFYNPLSHTSFFMLAYYNPLELLQDKQPKDPYPDITKRLIKEGFIRPDGMKTGDWYQYHKGVEGLRKYLEEIDWDNYGAGQMFPGGEEGDPYSLVTQYVKWIKGEGPGELLSLLEIPERFHFRMIRPDFWMWRRFMEVVNRYWGKVFTKVPYKEDED